MSKVKKCNNVRIGSVGCELCLSTLKMSGPCIPKSKAPLKIQPRMSVMFIVSLSCLDVWKIPGVRIQYKNIKDEIIVEGKYIEKLFTATKSNNVRKFSIQ